MARFPSYSAVIEYENRLIRERVPENFLINTATQIIRRSKPKKRYVHISAIRKGLKCNPRLKYLSNIILHQTFFKLHRDNFRSVTFEGKNGLSNTIVRLYPKVADFVHDGQISYSGDSQESFKSILEKYKMNTSEYLKAESIKLKISQVLKLNFNYNIEVIEFGSIPIKLATSISDYNILLKFPDGFTKGQINTKFDEIKSHLKGYGYKFKSEWRTKVGGRVMKFEDINSDFSINIGNYEEILCWKNKLIEIYSNLHPDIKSAFLLIKIWADRRKLNNPVTTHVINSYCHILMFIAYLIIIRAIPNLRTISPKYDKWEGRAVLYRPNVKHLKYTEPKESCLSQSELVNDGFDSIHIYYHKDLEIILGKNWSIHEAIQGYFYFMGYMFEYENWDISVYHGGIVESLQKIELVYETTKLLRIRHPFNPDQIESNSALPWCVDGLKWEFMRGYHLLSNSDWNELMREADYVDVQSVYEYNMYTYISLY